jgi:hypothetical protein
MPLTINPKRLHYHPKMSLIGTVATYNVLLQYCVSIHPILKQSVNDFKVHLHGSSKSANTYNPAY